MRKLLLVCFFASTLLTISCKRTIDEPVDLVASDFNFETTKDININIKVLTSDNKPLKYTLVRFYYPDNSHPYEPVFKALTDSNGIAKGRFKSPVYRNNLAVDLLYPGIRRNIVFDLKDGNLHATIGGADNKTSNTTFGNALSPARVSGWVDTDADGVDDTNDEFPTDPTRVYTLYYPYKSGWGTLAFEDSWPKKGDHDMNDLVVNYNYAMACNRDGNYVDITGKYKVVAAGAMNNNGFGVKLPYVGLFSGDKIPIQSVSGQQLTNNYIKVNSAGFEEAGINIIPFDNHRSVAKGHNGMINTVKGEPKINCDLVTVLVKFIGSVHPDLYQGNYYFKWGTLKLIGIPFNPFLIANGKRAYEIHQVGFEATENAKLAGIGKLYNTGDDAFEFKSKDGGSPWVLNFAESFDYPIEQSSIGKAYLHFDEWKAGKGYADWYQDKPGYRNADLIYK